MQATLRPDIKTYLAEKGFTGSHMGADLVNGWFWVPSDPLDPYSEPRWASQEEVARRSSWHKGVCMSVEFPNRLSDERLKALSAAPEENAIIYGGTHFDSAAPATAYIPTMPA